MLEATKGLTLTDEEVELNVTRAKEAALEAIRRMSVESSASKRPAKERPPKKARKSSLPAGVKQTAYGSWVSDGKQYIDTFYTAFGMVLFLYPNSVVFLFLVVIERSI